VNIIYVLLQYKKQFRILLLNMIFTFFTKNIDGVRFFVNLFYIVYSNAVCK